MVFTGCLYTDSVTDIYTVVMKEGGAYFLGFVEPNRLVVVCRCGKIVLVGRVTSDHSMMI